MSQSPREDPPDFDNIQKLAYLDKCLSETLRKYPVATLISREARNNCTIKGVRIPAGMNITIPATSVHNNPQFWPDPDTFDPERFSEEIKAKQEPFTYIPFGGGPRTCFGMRMSQYQIKMAAVEMLRNFRLFPCEKRNGSLVRPPIHSNPRELPRQALDILWFINPLR